MQEFATILLALTALLPLDIGSPRLAWLHRLSMPAPAAESQIARPAPRQWIAQPVRVGQENLSLRAKSALAIDFATAQVLHESASQAKLPIASITKMVTAMTVLESHKTDEIVTVPELPAFYPEEAQIGLRKGQRFLLGELLKAALIPSANDAAEALALWDSGTRAAFTAKMNRLAHQWGIRESNFASVSGLQDQDNFATAADLAKFAKIALANPEIRTWVATPASVISDREGKPYNLISTNQLLQDGRISGIKTGYTPAAGQSLIGLAEIRGRQVITVVLGSPDRFGETRKLLDWLERNWEWL